MPRKSTAALGVLVPLGRTPRLRPRDDMPAAVAAIFVETVETMPEDHFRPSDTALLESFCQAVALAREAYRQVEKQGPVDEKGRMSAWVTVLEKQHRVISNAAMRLRLAPQARIRPETVG